MTGADSQATAARSPLLLSRRFLPIFIVQALGAFNDNVFKNAFVSLLTYKLASQMDISLGILLAIASGVFILPFALMAPFAGQIADRVDKARMMRVVKFTEIVMMIGAAVAYHQQSVLSLYILLFFMGAQSAFFGPIKYGVLPQYLAQNELVKGNGLVQAATFLAILLGTIIGLNWILLEQGVLIVSVAVVGIAIIGFISSLFAPPAPPVDGDLDVLPNFGLRVIGQGGFGVTLQRAAPAILISIILLALITLFGPEGLKLGIGAAALVLVWATHLLWPSIKDSVDAARSVPVAWRAILSISWFWFVGATFMTQMPAFAKEQMNGDETVFTVLLAAFSIGIAIGSVLCGMLFRGAIKVGPAPWGAVAIAVFAIDIYFAAPPGGAPAGEALMNASDFLSSPVGWRVLGDFIGLAIGAGIYVTPLNAVYQHAAPHDARGRVVACSAMIDSAFMVCSSLVVMGLIGQGLFPQEIFALVGATGFIAAILTARRAPETWLGRTALTLIPSRGGE